MKLRTTPAILALALASFVGPALADGAINAVLGVRSLNDGAYWGKFDHPIGLGISADLALGPTLPLWINARAEYASHNGDSDGSSSPAAEDTLGIAGIALGLKLMPQSGVLRPYAGVGIQRDWVRFEQGFEVSDSDVSRGWYAEGGAMFWFARHFNVGMNLRWTKDTEVTLFGAEGDLDSRAYALVVGYTWGVPAPPRRHERRGQD